MAVLRFGGKGGNRARALIIKQLRRQFRVVDGSRLVAAAQRLGITPSRGTNLARAAQAVRARAVVGGTLAAGELAVAVYSGKSGQPVASGAVNWDGGGQGLAEVLDLIEGGIEQTQPLVAVPRRNPAPPKPVEEPLNYEPQAVDIEPPRSRRSRRRRRVSRQRRVELTEEDQSIPVERVNGPQPGQADRELSFPTEPKAAAWIGLGVWSRSFRLNDPVRDRPHPQYDSGVALALRLALLLRPFSFFSDGIPANFYLRLAYQRALGLSSQLEGADGTLGTSLSELIVDVGYDFKLLPSSTSPHVDLGVGYGLVDFAVDWQGITATLPSVAYRFLRFGIACRYPFLGFLGAHLRFDYRLVFGSGEIEEGAEDRWYGPANVGGVSGAIGLNGGVEGFVARLEYSYTRYFYVFTDAPGRQRLQQRSAGGALDIFHGFVVSVGYSY